MRRAVALALVLVVAAGCALGDVLEGYGDSVAMTDSSLVGTWWGGTTRVLFFGSDGSVIANDLPVPLVDMVLPPDFDRSASGADAAGTWRITPSGEVVLELELIAGAPTAMAGPELSSLRDEAGVVGLWFFYVGDGGNSWTVYHKV
ncbi:hypothetical protein [Asanoa sp. NPDC050611]|uniref:hypothetical protein n=1 Tax=Asanoa sp. NPDC050611 TaxID=3157098 RepID=UPI0033D75583